MYFQHHRIKILVFEGFFSRALKHPEKSPYMCLTSGNALKGLGEKWEIENHSWALVHARLSQHPPDLQDCPSAYPAHPLRSLHLSYQMVSWMSLFSSTHFHSLLVVL